MESVAENTSDGVVAPMLYGALFGAPGALAYKAVNTLDSMVGHPQPPHAELGWASARLDDLANLVPSRVTALAVAVVSGKPASYAAHRQPLRPAHQEPQRGHGRGRFRRRPRRRLGGTNTYGGVSRKGPMLGEGRLPGPGDIRRAVSLMRRCCVLLGALALSEGA